VRTRTKRAPADGAAQETGTHCGDCGEPQLRAPEGVTCRHGHAGAAALEETRSAPAPERRPVSDGRSLLDSFIDEESEAVRARVETFAERILAGAPRSAPRARGFQVEHVSMDTPDLVQIDTWIVGGTPEPEELPPVRGAFVKLAPTIRSSDRAAFDAGAVKQVLMGAGARGVIVAPKVVADVSVRRERAEEKREQRSADEHVAAWFDAAQGLSEEESRAARALCLDALGKAGVR